MSTPWHAKSVRSQSSRSVYEAFWRAPFWIAGALLVVFATLSWLLVHSDAGRILIAIRENEQRCRYLGLDTSRLKTAVFVVCAIVAAIASLVMPLCLPDRVVSR